MLSVYFIATSIIGEAGSASSGLACRIPTPSLGLILNEGRQYVEHPWWPVLLAGAVLVIVVLFLNSLGDHLRTSTTASAGEMTVVGATPASKATSARATRLRAPTCPLELRDLGFSVGAAR